LWFRARGHQAYKVENKLWRQLFGLLFWDLLFQTDGPHTYSPFERLPAALTERRFLLEQRAAITARLELLNKPQQVKQQLLKISAAHFGVANGIFRWRQNMLNILFAFLDAAPTEAIKSMLWRLCENYVDVRHGYPDLLVIDDHGVRFIEIKSDGDQLRRNQLLRIEQLQQAGFRADILKVRWVLDPMQPYVVVDVETTGGRGDHHRVTEIGAVKVVNGEITDRFQSLINPQRNIPAKITR